MPAFRERPFARVRQPLRWRARGGPWRRALAATSMLAAAAFVGPTALGLSPGAISTAHAQDYTEGACIDDEGVTVVVDFQGLGGSTIVRCALGAPQHSVAALEAAGVQVTGTNQHGTAFVCRLDGKPGPDREPCITTPDATEFWSYWHAEANGSWESSQLGGTARTPPPGTFEGWVFYEGPADGNLPTDRIPPPVAPTPTDPPSSGPGNGSESGSNGGSNGSSSNGESSGDGANGGGSSGSDSGSDGGSAGGDGSSSDSAGRDGADTNGSGGNDSTKTDGTGDNAGEHSAANDDGQEPEAPANEEQDAPAPPEDDPVDTQDDEPDTPDQSDAQDEPDDSGADDDSDEPDEDPQADQDADDTPDASDLAGEHEGPAAEDAHVAPADDTVEVASRTGGGAMLPTVGGLALAGAIAAAGVVVARRRNLS